MQAFRPSARSTTYRRRTPDPASVLSRSCHDPAPATGRSTSLEAAARSAQALRTVRAGSSGGRSRRRRNRRRDRPSIVHDAAADAGRERHVKQRIEAPARAVTASPSAPTFASLSMHGTGRPDVVADEIRQIESGPAADVRGKDHALGREIHGAAEADAAARPIRIGLRQSADQRDPICSIIHSRPPSRSVGRGFPRDHAVTRRTQPSRIWCRRYRWRACSCGHQFTLGLEHLGGTGRSGALFHDGDRRHQVAEPRRFHSGARTASARPLRRRNCRPRRRCPAACT